MKELYDSSDPTISEYISCLNFVYCFYLFNVLFVKMTKQIAELTNPSAGRDERTRIITAPPSGEE